MKIQFLGTAGTERVPSMFCECETCEKARKYGGKRIRTRTQALIDDLILIDFPADSFIHFERYNVPYKNIRHCLITHSHMDHLYTEEVVLKKERFAHVYENKEPLVFYSEQSGFDLIENKRFKSNLPAEDFHAKKISYGECFKIYDYEIIPLNAVHDPASTPLIYIIKKDGKSIFYSTDTSEYCSETFEYLKSLDKPLSLIALDCTYCCSETSVSGHMDLGRCTRLKEKLIEIGAADENTVFVLTHFSHNGEISDHEEFSKIAQEQGFTVAYDGMIKEV